MTTAPTTQDVAVVVCGGGDPFAEYALFQDAVIRTGIVPKVFVGNDMIAHFPDEVDVAGTLHPDKITGWTGQRQSLGYPPAPCIWSHRPFSNVTHWTRDWSGSTGLFLIKVARELGHTHIVLCGVPMVVTANHFIRGEPWNAANGFRRGWTNHHHELPKYVRSYSGWTEELFGKPTDEWLSETIADEHALHVPRQGLRA